MSDARFEPQQLYHGHISGNISEVRRGLACLADVVEPSEFFQWESSRAEFIDVEPMDSVFHEPRYRYFRNNAEPDSCWTNSILPALIIPGVRYCEGWLIGRDDYPVRHAWNSYGGRYFDLTFEIAAKPGAIANYIQTFSCDGRRANILNTRKTKRELYPRFYGLAIWHWYQRTANPAQKRKFEALFKPRKMEAN